MLRNEINSNIIQARKFKFPAMLTILLFVVCLAWMGKDAYTTNAVVADAMTQRGWHKITQTKKGDADLIFMFKCTENATCNKVYNQTFAKAFPPLSLYAFGGVFLLMMLVVPKMNVVENRKSPGVGTWAVKDDMTDYMPQTPLPALPRRRQRVRLPIRDVEPGSDPENPVRFAGYYGLMPDGSVLMAPEHLRNSHNAVIGGPGARKSTGYHKPNILMDALFGNTAIVADSKYPDPRAGFSDMVIPFHYCGRRVQVFTPFEYNTMRLDIMGSINSMDEALEIAELLVPGKASGEDNAEFYRGIERNILARLLYAVALGNKNRSMKQVYELLLLGRTKILKFIKTHPEAEIREGSNVLEEVDARQMVGVIMNLMNKLIVFNHPMLDRATTYKEGEMLDLKAAFLEPTLLFFGMPEAKMRGVKGRVVLQLLKRMVDQALNQVCEENGGSSPIHANFYLDEFANMGAIPEIEVNMATMRSRRVSYHITLQNKAQGVKVYGKPVFDSLFDNNIMHMIVFPRFLNTKDERQYWAEMIGKTTVIDQSEGVSTEKTLLGITGPNRRITRTKREVNRFLLEPEEMRTFPKDQAVLFSIGNKPAVIYTPRLDEAKIGGLKNPLHYYHKYFFPKGLDVRAEAQEIISKLKLTSQGEPEELLKEKTLHAVLSDWIQGILTRGVIVDYHREDKRINKIKILRSSISEDLLEGAVLELLEQQEFIRPEKEYLVVTNKALKQIGDVAVAELKNLYHKGRVLVWIRQNGKQLEGHPDFVDDEDKDKVLGQYSEYLLVLNKAATKALFGQSISHAKIKRIGSKEFNEIPFHDTTFLAQAFGEEEMPDSHDDLDTLLQKQDTTHVEKARQALLQELGLEEKESPAVPSGKPTPASRPKTPSPANPPVQSSKPTPSQADAPSTEESTFENPQERPRRKAKPTAPQEASGGGGVSLPPEETPKSYVPVSQRLQTPPTDSSTGGGKKWKSASQDKQD